MIHVTGEDVTDARQPSAAQAAAIALLELNPAGRPVLRLTLAQWRHVDRVVIELARRDARSSGPVVPAPRPPHCAELAAPAPSRHGARA